MAKRLIGKSDVGSLSSSLLSLFFIHFISPPKIYSNNVKCRLYQFFLLPEQTLSNVLNEVNYLNNGYRLNLACVVTDGINKNNLISLETKDYFRLG